MKKTFLFLMMTLLFCIGSSAFNNVEAQDVVTIPADAETLIETGSATESGIAPINNNYEYSVSQIYYTADEINKEEGGVINGISFRTKDNNENNYPYTREIEIYIVNTGETSSFSSKSMMQFSESDLYFSGNVEFTADAWVTITFTKKFTYESGNVLICVNDKYYSDNAPNDNKNYVSPTAEFYAYTSGVTMRCLTHKNTSSSYDPTNTSIKNLSSGVGNTGNLPFIQFTFKEQQQAPITLVASPDDDDITTCDEVKFTVTQGEGTGKDVTSSATIYYQVNEAEPTELYDNPFTPSATGEYIFYAKKGSVQSENIIINVTEAPYVLKASPTNIMADGEDITTFSVTQCGNTVEGFTFYVNNEPIVGNTFATAELGEYTVYAEKGDITTDEITIYATEWKVIGWVTDLVLTEYYNTNSQGAKISKKYENVAEITNEVFTLWLAITGNNYDNGIILNNNVYSYEVGTGNTGFVERAGHRPTTPQPLSIPGTLFVENIGEVTITEIADDVFYNYFKGDETGSYEATGNSLNNNISSLTIPSTITKIGDNAFSFTMSEGFEITSKAVTPPTITETTFGIYHPSTDNNYKKASLLVPSGSTDAYKTAEYWENFDKHENIKVDESTMIKYNGNGDWTDEDNWSNGSTPSDEETVIINGNVQVSSNVTIGGITINEGYSLTIINGGILHINGTVTNRSDNIITIKDGGQLYSTNDVTVTVEKSITGYGDDDNITEGWYAISTPVNSGESNDEGYYSENIDNIENLIPTDERRYDLYRYYEAGEYDANTDKTVSWWENHKMNDEDSEEEYYDWSNPEFTTLSSGRGYLYASSENVTLKFTNTVRNNGISFPCTADYGGEDENFLGFNLMGNPFTHNITAANMSMAATEMPEAYYTLSYDGTWVSNLFSNDKTEIKVGEAFLIKVTESDELIFSYEAARSRFANNGSINIVVSNDKYSDNAIVSFSEGKGLNKFPHLNKEAHEVYVIDNETKYGVATMNDDVTTIPVGFKANTMGEYTIAVKAQDCKFNSMTLTDKMTGVKTNLLTDSYTFIATTNDNPDRFTLTLNADTNADFIYINNNEMIINNIEGDGLVQIYDVMGRSVATYNVSGSANISMEALSEGIYIVRMTDANGVKTQKVVNN